MTHPAYAPRATGKTVTVPPPRHRLTPQRRCGRRWTKHGDISETGAEVVASEPFDGRYHDGYRTATASALAHLAGIDALASQADDRSPMRDAGRTALLSLLTQVEYLCEEHGQNSILLDDLRAVVGESMDAIARGEA